MNPKTQQVATAATASSDATVTAPDTPLYVVEQAFYLGTQHCQPFERVALNADQADRLSGFVRLAEQAAK